MTDDSTLPISFACRWSLVRDIEALAMIEGISRADVVRRAVLFDIRRRKEEWLASQRRAKAADADIAPEPQAA
jgi:hypothetical protein